MSDPSTLPSAQALLYYEDLSIGTQVETDGRTISESDLVSFAGLSGDFNPLHTDAEYAKSTQHGQRIAHGLLVLSISSGLYAQLPFSKSFEKAVIGLAEVQSKWLRPTFIGDTVRVAIEIQDKVPSKKPDRGSIIMQHSTRNQRGEAVLETRWRVVLKRRST